MKRIVVCADGTWNQRDQINSESGKRRPTNVTKIARSVISRDRTGIDQVVFYHDGVGTSGAVDQVTGGAFGHGLESNIRDIYRFILYNYQSGDELYFFGFSRGAFTVRSLSGFMRRYGLIRKFDDFYVPEMYQCYERGILPGTPEYEKVFHRKDGTKRIESVLQCPPIKFMGLWDTVGSLGAPGLLGQILNGGKYKHHDVDLHGAINIAVHALGLDEQRAPFAPTFWKKPANWSGKLEQCWFAGVHSNIGGGYQPDGLANEALHWIADHAAEAGLELDRDYLGHFKPAYNSKLNESMTLSYRLLGKHVRPVGKFLEHGEKLHQSVIRRMAEMGYAPENLRGYSEGAANWPPIASVTN